jgi:NitT/TauT family transport system substrate-binding protein
MHRRSIVQWFGLFLVGWLLPLSAIACSPQQAVSDTSSSQPLVVGVQPWIGFQGHYIATDRDLFTPEGVSVKEEFFQVATDTNTALVAGKVDLAWIGGPDLVTLVNQAPSLKIIMVSDYSNGADGLIGRDISGPADLRGKTVAREDAPYAIVFLGEYLQQAGLTEEDVNVVSLSAADAVAAFISGDVDAATTYEPWLSKATTEANAEVLFTSKDSNVLPIVLATTSEVIDARRDEILKYLRAVDQAIAFAQENPEEAAEICAKKLGVTPAEIPAQLAGIRPFDIQGNKDVVFNPDSPLYLVNSLESAAKTVYDLGKISQPIDAQGLVDDSLVKAL